MTIVDLTHTFTSDIPVYPGDPKPELRQIATLAKDGFNDHQLTTAMHIGTHMDAPLHMIAGGKSMDAIPTDKFMGPGIRIDARGKHSVDTDLVPQMITAKGSIVLIYTGYGAKWKTDAYFTNTPAVTEGFAKRMVELGVSCVGMDMPGPDAPPFAVHKILLGNGILILENLTNLDQLPETNFSVIALPMKLVADAAPVRVVAQIP